MQIKIKTTALTTLMRTRGSTLNFSSNSIFGSPQGAHGRSRTPVEQLPLGWPVPRGACLEELLR